MYITYKDEDEFPAKSLYKTSPVQVSLTPQEAETLSSPMVVETDDKLLVKVGNGDKSSADT